MKIEAGSSRGRVHAVSIERRNSGAAADRIWAATAAKSTGSGDGALPRFLTREAGERDRRRRWRGRMPASGALRAAPSTMLRMVPLPVLTGEDPSDAPSAIALAPRGE